MDTTSRRLPFGGAVPASLGEVTGVGDFVWLDARVIPPSASEATAPADGALGGDEAVTGGAAEAVGGGAVALDLAPAFCEKIEKEGKDREGGRGREIC